MPDSDASNQAVATQAAPVTVSEAELENLLDEAAALSREISEEAGEISNEAPADEGGHQEEAAAPPIEEAEEPESPDEPAPAADRAEQSEPPDAAEQAKPLPDLLQDPDAQTEATATETEPELTVSEDSVPEASDSPPPPRPPIKIETRDEELAEKAASLKQAEEESGEPEDAQKQEARAAGPSVMERLTAACRFAMRMGSAAPIGVANGGLMIFVLLDRPFRDVSPGRKRLLGLIGLATLLAGIITWVLPEMMNDNPFAAMELHTKSRG